MVKEIKANEAARYVRLTFETLEERKAVESLLELLGVNCDPWTKGKTKSGKSVYIPFHQEGANNG